MMIFSEDTEIARSILTMIALYSVLYWNRGNLNIWPTLLFPRLGL